MGIGKRFFHDTPSSPADCSSIFNGLRPGAVLVVWIFYVTDSSLSMCPCQTQVDSIPQQQRAAKTEKIQSNRALSGVRIAVMASA
jgi:hypothetical protein